MARRFFLKPLTLTLFLLTPLLAQQEKGPWRASSNNANSITGDLILADEKISINFNTFTMVRARDLTSSEISALFDPESPASGTGGLYHLDIPAAKKFLHRNSLCGDEDTQWMATFVSGKTLHLAFFSGPRAPVLTTEAISNTSDLCGTFTYAR
jgi:hypothetical protein